MQVSVRSSVCPSINIYPGCLVSAIPLTVLYWSFWNFACVFFMVWGCAYGLNTICKSFFTLGMHTVGTCKRNSSCRFLPIVLKLCLCFLHGMKMSMWFGYNSRIIFCHLFHLVNLVIFHPGLGGSVGCAVRLETRRSRVQPPPRSATFFRGDWSWNIFYGHSLPSADSRRAIVSFWRKNVHNTG